MDIPTVVTAALQIFMGLVGLPEAITVIGTLLEMLGVSVSTVSLASFAVDAAAFVGIAYLVFTGNTAVVQVLDARLVGLAKLLSDVIIILGGFGFTLYQIAKRRSSYRLAVSRLLGKSK